VDPTIHHPRNALFGKLSKFVIGGVVVAGVGIAISTPVSHAVQVKTDQSLATILPASIQPHTLATINSQFPGYVASIDVTPGTEVKAGTPLLALVNPEFELEYERAKSHFEAVQQKLATIRDSDSGNTDNQTEAESARRALNAAKERLAMVSLDGAQEACDKANTRVKELQQLVRRQLATDIELEEATRDADAALRNLRAEREHLSRLKEEVEVAQARVDRARRSESSKADTANLRIELREAAEALRIASERRTSQKIVSTVSGTVLRVMVNAGDEIPSGIPLLQIAQLDRLDFDVPVGAELAKRIRTGDKVKVRVPTEPPELVSAPISAITLIPAREQSAYTVRITMQNPSPSTVLVGLTGEVEFPHSENVWRVFQF
jgi:multidrug resistance efflux pump